MSRTEAGTGRRRLLIIGYGNEWRGDDGAGPAVVRELSGQTLRPEVQTIVCRQLLPEIADDVSRATCVYFVDADAATEAGQIRVRRLSRPRGIISDHDDSSMPPPIAELFGHRWSPRSILRLAHDIYGRVPHARLYTVGVEQIDEEATLSGVVRASVDRLVERWLRRFALPPSFPVDDRPRPFENSSTS